MTIHSPRRPTRSTIFAIAALGLLVVFYLLRRAPWAYNDDVFFTSTAIELARTGQLTNPHVLGWLHGFGTDKVYVQLPFYFYSLAAWIKTFGVGTLSFKVFHWSWYVVGMAGLVRVVRGFGVPTAATLALAAIYLTGLLQLGFRPDGEAFGLMFLGLALLDTNSPLWRRVLAMTLLGFAVLTYPMPLGFAPPFVVAIWWRQQRPGVTTREWLRDVVRVWAAPTADVVAVVFTAFLAMIGGHLREFLTIFNAHRLSRSTYSGGFAREFFKLLTEYNGTVLLVPVVALLIGAVVFVLVRWRSVEDRVRVLVCACAAAALGCVFLYVSNAMQWVVWSAFCAGLALASSKLLRPWRRWAFTGLAALILWNHALWIISVSRARFPSAEHLRAVREEVLRSGKPVVFDSSTARYVFDFQLPPGSRDLGYLIPWRGGQQTLADKDPATIWVVTPRLMGLMLDNLPPEYTDYPRITVGGHAFQSLPLERDGPVIIP